MGDSTVEVTIKKNPNCNLEKLFNGANDCNLTFETVKYTYFTGCNKFYVEKMLLLVCPETWSLDKLGPETRT